MRNLVELFRQLVDLVPYLSDEVTMMVSNVDDPRHLAYLIATSLRMDIEDAQSMLEIDDVKEKLRRLTDDPGPRAGSAGTGQKDPKRGPGQHGKGAARVLFARAAQGHPPRVGRRGRADGRDRGIPHARSKSAGMPEEAEKEALRELSRMEKMPIAAAEYCGDQDLSRLDGQPALEQGHRGQPRHRARARGPGRGPLWAGGHQGPHPRVPRRAQAAPGAQGGARGGRADRCRPDPPRARRA